MTKTNTTTKPHVQILAKFGANYYRVHHRGLVGDVWEGQNRWHAIWTPGEGREGVSVRYRVLTGERALQELVALLDGVADCRELAVRVDQLESKGLRAKLERLGGEQALAVFDAALAQVQADDARGLPIVRGMVKAVSGRKLPSARSMILPRHGASYALTVVPGFSVSFAGGPTYFIGQEAEYGSYNLHYFGVIESITAKTVTIRQGLREQTRRLKMDEFAWRNRSTPESKAERNTDVWMHC